MKASSLRRLKKLLLTLLIIALLHSSLLGLILTNLHPVADASPGAIVAVNPSKTPSSEGALMSKNPDPPYDKFLIYINIMNVEDLYAFGVILSWSPGTLLEPKMVKNGGFLPDEEFVYDVGPDYVAAANNLKEQVEGESGDGNLVKIVFEVEQTGNTSLSLTYVSLINSKLEPIPYEPPVNGTFYTTWPVAKFSYLPDPAKGHEYYGRPIVGETVTFNASESYDPDEPYDDEPGGIVKYEWNFDDGTPKVTKEKDPTTEHEYEEAGKYYVTLKVTDDDGESYSYNLYPQGIEVKHHDIEILNVVVNSTHALPGSPILINVTVLNNGTTTEYFNISAYYDNELIETKFFGYLYWDGYDWEEKFGLLPGQNETTTIIWNTTGVTPGVVYTIHVNISIVNPATLQYVPDIEPDLSDNAYTAGIVEVGSHDVAITNVTCSPTTVSIGEVVTINVTVTNKGDFTETFNVTAYYGEIPIDNQTATLDAQASITLTFPWDTTWVAAGTYTIWANASKVPNETNITNNLFIDGDVTVQIPLEYPKANFTYLPEFPLVGEVVTFNSTSYDEDGYITGWEWDFNGDGKIDAKTENATWIYTEPGKYIVRLRVTDNAGLSSGIQKLITVLAPPTANFTYFPEKPLINQKVTFNASLSRPNGGVIVSYEWDFGDGTTKIYVGGNLTAITTHQYITSGNYTVVLTVTDSEQRDSENLTHTISKTIRVLAPPVAKFTFSPPDPMRTELITFDASASKDDDGTIVSYEWDFGDGTTKIYVGGNLTAITTHTYAEPLPGGKPFYVKLNVTDNDGLHNTFKLEVYILPVRDIAVSDVVLSSDTVVIGNMLAINVTVTNEGDVALPFNLTAYYNETKIKTLDVTEKLGPGSSNTLTFTWDTTNLNPGTYTIKAIVETKQRDLNTANNEIMGGTVTLKVRSILAILVYPANITLGETITINGTINPVRSGVDIYIYYRLSGEIAWIPLATVKTEATGRYQYDWTPQAQGTYQVKASWTGDATATDAESSIITVVVKERPAVPLGFIHYIVIGCAIAIAGSIMALYFFRMRKRA